MSAHVVVLDSQLRRATVKTTPNKPLSDVLSEACEKLSLDVSSYGLKYVRYPASLSWEQYLTIPVRHKNKAIDLSRSIRLAGLSSGAKLELTKLSKSPSAVTVCLQLPDPESQDIPNGRLVEKFPSTTTLWLVLRKFESGMGVKRNYTARSVPQTREGILGAGRLVHEGPVIQALNREFSSFSELQKSLAQLGVNDGNILLRLSFRVTDIPLEEALSQMEEYFKAIEGTKQGEAHTGDVGTSNSIPANNDGILPDDPAATAASPQPSSDVDPSPLKHEATTETSDTQLQNDGLDPTTVESSSSTAPIPTSPNPNRSSITVFAPPSNSKPRATSISFHEKDYEPTIDHAKTHQARLKDVGRNKRLLTDAEIAEQESLQAEKRAAIKSVEIKVRMPDQTQVVDTFSDMDTSETIYARVKAWMQHEEEPVVLSFNGKKGIQTVPQGGREMPKRLIKDLGMEGRILVTMSWGDGASAQAKKDPLLKGEYRSQAQQLPTPPEVKEVEMTDSKDIKGWEPPKPNDGGSKMKKVPKWANKLFKK